MTEARDHLRATHSLHDKLEEIYIGAVDFSVIDEITKDLIEEIGL